jgi:hypothetical protein
MIELQSDLARRMLYIFHLGFVEARMLAQAERCEQIVDLADALEPLPVYLDNWRDEFLELVEGNLRTYQDKYPGVCFDYLKYLSDESPQPLKMCH